MRELLSLRLSLSVSRELLDRIAILQAGMLALQSVSVAFEFSYEKDPTAVMGFVCVEVCGNVSLSISTILDVSPTGRLFYRFRQHYNASAGQPSGMNGLPKF